MKLRWAVTAALMALCAGVAMVARMGAHEADPAELLRRCNESHPAWLSYQEDIKGQVGATPVARWRGRPVEVRQQSGELTVTFLLESPWADYDAAVPVLLRDPLGREHRQDRVEKDGALRRYTFEMPQDSAAMTLPWVEIHYPHTERRIALGAEGRWTDTGTRP